MALLLAVAAGRCAAQQPDDAPAPPAPASQAPAPIVRKTPKPPVDAAPDGTVPTATGATPHLTVAHPVIKKTPATAAAPTAKPVEGLQASAAGPFNRTVIVLDPAHGGGDTGSRISDSLTEKDVTLALAFRLRSLLNARGFTTIMTRESDDASSTPGTALTLDDRAGLANRARPLACVLLHATASGRGRSPLHIGAECRSRRALARALAYGAGRLGHAEPAACRANRCRAWPCEDSAGEQPGFGAAG